MIIETVEPKEGMWVWVHSCSGGEHRLYVGRVGQVFEDNGSYYLHWLSGPGSCINSKNENRLFEENPFTGQRAEDFVKRKLKKLEEEVVFGLEQISLPAPKRYDSDCKMLRRNMTDEVLKSNNF